MSPHRVCLTKVQAAASQGLTHPALMDRFQRLILFAELSYCPIVHSAVLGSVWGHQPEQQQKFLLTEIRLEAT